MSVMINYELLTDINHGPKTNFSHTDWSTYACSLNYKQGRGNDQDA